MSSIGSIGRPQHEDNDDDNAGFVTSRWTTIESSNNSMGGESPASRSQKMRQEYQVPIHRHQADEESSYVSAPPRLNTPASKQRRRVGTPSFSKVASVDDFSLPPEFVPPEADQSSFKGWLMSGLLGGLNKAAGVTLSTTGQLISPGLSILLPGLLALFVDFMDSVTPSIAQDWFRILSSSVCHFFSVLRSTTRGKSFSIQFYIVLQDILQAASAPESRQVLVDGMACSVKFADALNTPEMQAWLEQFSILGCRLVDAAASGKSKQLMQDTKDLALKGIEMATDPATTLALAEVTARLCHALEEAQQALNPTPRARRNAQNQATYLNPFQMADFPQQVSMEEIILSCLGQEEDDRDGDDAASIPSNVVWHEEASATGSNYHRDWKEVNVQLLKERIVHNMPPQPRKKPMSSATSSAKSSASSVIGTPMDTLPIISSNDEEDEMEEVDRESKQMEGPLAKPNDESYLNGVKIAKSGSEDQDIEDIVWDRLPSYRKTPKRRGSRRYDDVKKANESPSVSQFYSTLDDLLTQRRDEKPYRQVDNEEATINNPRVAAAEGNDSDWKVWQAKAKTLRRGHIESVRVKTMQRRKQLNKFTRLPKKHQGLVLITSGFIAFVVFFWMGFALYGMYAFVKSHSNSMPIAREATATMAPLNPEVVIRIIREVVHVNADGGAIATFPDTVVSEAEIGKITECAASVFETEGTAFFPTGLSSETTTE